MNQILEVKNNKNDDSKNVFEKTKKKKKVLFLKTQLYLSTLVIVGLLINIAFFYREIDDYNKISKTLFDNYSVYKLYANNSSSNTYPQNFSGIVGKIIIPSINIEYPIYYTLDEEQLKITPCILQGNIDNTNGNLCIAGHNYNNDKFFSDLFLLSANDDIFIYDNSDKKFLYKVFTKYEVLSSDLSPINNYDNGKILTLITCNNSNGKKIIIQAKKESL